jgi:hypothetical protein
VFDIEALYVDCLPLVGRDEVECFSDIVAEAAQAVAQVTKIPDWRLHEFGKGKGFIAVQLGTMTMPKHIYVSSREDLSALALELLAPRAAQVIIGVK